jgi:hypothetical protein
MSFTVNKVFGMQKTGLTILFSWMILVVNSWASGSSTGNAHRSEKRDYAELLQSLGTEKVAGRSALHLFQELSVWWQHKDTNSEVAEAVRTFGKRYLPLVVQCLSKSGVVITEVKGSSKKQREEIESNQVRALAVLWILREKGAPIIPELAKLLEDRTWTDRIRVANALALIGPTAASTVALALADLTSESTMIRFQGLLILGGVGGRSDEAVRTLIQYTASDSSQLQGTAIWGLGLIAKAGDSDPGQATVARLCLEKLARSGFGNQSFCAKLALGLDPRGPGSASIRNGDPQP